MVLYGAPPHNLWSFRWSPIHVALLASSYLFFVCHCFMSHIRSCHLIIHTICQTCEVYVYTFNSMVNTDPTDPVFSPHPSLPQQNLTVVKNRRNNMWGRGRIDNMAIIKCYKCQNIMLGNRRHVFNKKIYGSNWSN